MRRKFTEQELNDIAFTLSVIAIGLSFLSFMLSIFG